MFHKRDIGKQFRPWSDAAEHGVWSGALLFVLVQELVLPSQKHAYIILTPLNPTFI